MGSKLMVLFYTLLFHCFMFHVSNWILKVVFWYCGCSGRVFRVKKRVIIKYYILYIYYNTYIIYNILSGNNWYIEKGF